MCDQAVLRPWSLVSASAPQACFCNLTSAPQGCFCNLASAPQGCFCNLTSAPQGVSVILHLHIRSVSVTLQVHGRNVCGPASVRFVVSHRHSRSVCCCASSQEECNCDPGSAQQPCVRECTSSKDNYIKSNITVHIRSLIVPPITKPDSRGSVCKCVRVIIAFRSTTAGLRWDSNHSGVRWNTCVVQQ